ncbi:MAG: hypothetical protein GY769_20050 [bacterium]|nr:hypothetical protein [bacterium]
MSIFHQAVGNKDDHTFDGAFEFLVLIARELVVGFVAIGFEATKSGLRRTWAKIKK